MSEQRTIAKNTSVLALATFLSRIGGLIRDMVLARFLGAGMTADAFFMAFTLPNLLRRFFAEGSLTAAFVPTFSRIYHEQGRQEARRMASSCLGLLLLILAAVSLLGIFFSEELVGLIGRGFAAVPGKLELTARLNRLMFPYIVFASVLALFTGILNVAGHYFMPAFSPLLLNLAMIASLVLGGLWFGQPVTALALGVLVGGLIQLLVQLPVLSRAGLLPGLRGDFAQPAVRKVAALMIPGLFGVAVYQINVVLSRVMASFLDEGSVSYLYYGQRLFEFPQGIFIVALAQALLPSLSRQASAGDLPGLKNSLRFSLALVIVVTLPAAAGLALCAIPLFSLFFMGGQFDYHQVQQAALALAAYAPGLLFVGLSRMLVPVFYAMENTRTPVAISFWTMLVNVAGGLVLMRYFGHVGLAAALSLSSAFNALLLLILLSRRMGGLELGPLASKGLRSLTATGVMGGFVAGVCLLHDWSRVSGSFVGGLVLAAAVGGGGLIYFGACLLLGLSEARDFMRLIRNKLSRRRGQGA